MWLLEDCSVIQPFIDNQLSSIVHCGGISKEHDGLSKTKHQASDNSFGPMWKENSLVYCTVFLWNIV